MQYQIETQIQEDGKIILENLPFQKGESITVIISQNKQEIVIENQYPLHGTKIEYKEPFEAVAEDEWSILQ